MSYDLNGDKYFICINITKYDDNSQNRIGAEINTHKLIETFKKGVDSLKNLMCFTKTNSVKELSRI